VLLCVLGTYTSSNDYLVRPTVEAQITLFHRTVIQTNYPKMNQVTNLEI